MAKRDLGTGKSFAVPIDIAGTFDVNGSGPGGQRDGVYVADLGTTAGTTLNPTYTAALAWQVGTSRSSAIAVGTDGNLYGFRSHSGAGVYTWQSKVKEADTAAALSATNPINRGGTNGTALPTAGGVSYGTGSAYAFTPAGSAKQALVSNGAGAPTWATLDLTYLPDAAFKKSVKAATTANITLSGTQTINGIALVAGDRVLVKNQTTPAQNGIYDVATGAWARSAGANSSSEIAGAVVNVDAGTQGGVLYTTTFKSTDTLGTTAMNWYAVLDSNSGAPKASPAFTGTPTAPTAAAGTNTTQLATTAFVTAAANLKANLASPALTGTPTAPTATAGTNTAQLATTAFAAAIGALKADLTLGNQAAMEVNRESKDTGLYTYGVTNSTTNRPSGLSYGSALNWGRGALGSAQMVAGWTSGDQDFLAFRSLRDNTDNWWPWKRIFHEGYPQTTGATQANTDSSTKLATTAFVQERMNAAVSSSSSSLSGLDTVLRELIKATTPPGSILHYAGANAPAGWVLAHGGYIGPTGSGTAVRANDDTFDLFSLLWSLNATDYPLINSGAFPVARGASAQADFNAGYRIKLPDMSGNFLRGQNSAAYGYDQGRVLGSVQDTATQNHQHYEASGFDGAAIYNWSEAGGAPIHGSTVVTANRSTVATAAPSVGPARVALTSDYLLAPSGESRPANLAFRVIIKL